MRALQAASAAVVVLSVPVVCATEVDTVVVTANRLSRSLDDTFAAVSVVTREDIERQQARSIDDVLRGMEGISIGNSGGPGRLTSYYVRGADADQLLVLVDGVRIGSATAGTAALQNLPVEQIERVEFVRGPRSSLYGSEAIGGVLQVFTRRGAAAPSLALSGGSFGTRQAEGSVGFGAERAYVNLSASAQSQDGANACTGSSTLFAGCFTEEPDRDGYAYRSLSATAGLQWGTATTISASFWRAQSDVDFDGSFANHSDIVQQVAGLDLRQGFGGRWTITLKAGRAWDESDDALDGVPMSRFRTVRDSASLQADWRFAAHQSLSLGVDHGRDRVSGSEDFDVESRDNTAVFVQYAGALGRLRVEASLRTDDNEQFGTHTTGGVGLAWPLAAGVELVAQYGTGFKTPTFNELYYPFFGNPLLEPELSRSTEFALQGRTERHSWPSRPA
jgi:vitamin B12 transporter